MAIKTYNVFEISYKVWNKLFKKEVPYLIAVIISHLSKNGSNFEINTYDGSDQCVHPDIIEYRGNIYLCLTPYPYGIDTYENPSVYIKKENWKKIKNPLRVPSNFDLHLSDPCMYIRDDKLAICFRETKKEDSKKSILYEMETGDGITWSLPKTLCNYNGKDFISPAILKSKQYYLFYVNLKNKENILEYKTSVDGLIFKGEYKVNLIGFNKDLLWHIGFISTEKNNSKCSTKGEFYCAITTINSENEYKLFVGKLLYDEEWYLFKGKEVIDSVIIKAKIVYKSCFFFDNGNFFLLISLMTKNRTWKLYKKHIDLFDMSKSE